MLRYLPVALVAVVILGGTVYDGLRSHRWSPSASAEQYARVLESFPKRISTPSGDWIGADDQPVDPRVAIAAGAVGRVSRVYRNVKTKQQVGVWFIVGPFQATSIHTPDVCYIQADQKFADESVGRQRHTIELKDAPPAELYTAIFQAPRTGAMQRVFWTWVQPPRPGDADAPAPRFTAPENPKRAFAGEGALFKLQLSAGVTARDEAPDASPCVELAKGFLPVALELVQRDPGQAP